ncbi:hypothetical protein ON010_g8985 [Phytophthora cinnamomi]|nr:hypothetical protein ON010_g8985 [Phytophthora cinnamomi]
MSAVVDAVFGSYDVKNSKQWRDEDLLHREQQKQWPRAARDQARVGEAADRRAPPAAADRLAAVGHAGLLRHHVHPGDQVAQERHESSAAHRVRDRRLPRVPVHAAVHLDLHAAAAGADTLRDAHAGRRGAAALGPRAGLRVALHGLVDWQVRAGVAAGLPALPCRRVLLPGGDRSRELDRVHQVHDRGRLGVGALCGRTAVHQLADRQSLAIPGQVFEEWQTDECAVAVAAAAPIFIEEAEAPCPLRRDHIYE